MSQEASKKIPAKAEKGKSILYCVILTFKSGRDPMDQVNQLAKKENFHEFYLFSYLVWQDQDPVDLAIL